MNLIKINSLDARTDFLRKTLKGLNVTLVYSATAGKEGQLTARLIGNFLNAITPEPRCSTTINVIGQFRVGVHAPITRSPKLAPDSAGRSCIL